MIGLMIGTQKVHSRKGWKRRDKKRWPSHRHMKILIKLRHKENLYLVGGDKKCPAKGASADSKKPLGIPCKKRTYT